MQAVRGDEFAAAQTGRMQVHENLARPRHRHRRLARRKHRAPGFDLDRICVHGRFHVRDYPTRCKIRVESYFVLTAQPCHIS